MKKPLIITISCFLVLGLFVCKAAYWVRVGDGISYQVETENEISPLEAKERSKSFNIVYNSNKTYRISNVYQRTITRGTFPTTEVNDVLVDGPILKWYK